MTSTITIKIIGRIRDEEAFFQGDAFDLPDVQLTDIEVIPATDTALRRAIESFEQRHQPIKFGTISVVAI